MNCQHSDSSCRRFSIETPDPECQFEQILALGWGSACEVNDSNFGFVRSVVRELGNLELYQTLVKQFEPNLTVSNVFQRIEDAEAFGFPFDDLILFCASNFFQIQREFVGKVSLQTLYQVLSHPSLQLGSEDQLYQIIASRFESSFEYFSLIEFVRFEYLNTSNMNHFVGFARAHFDLVNQSVWHALCTRLECETILTTQSPRVIERLIPFENSPLDGIIAALTEECGGSVSEKGVVKISGTPLNDQPDSAPAHAADFGKSNYFHSANSVNQWLCYDFRSRRVRLSHYSIRSFSGNYYPRSWVIEGSLDGRNWSQIDRQEGNTKLDAQHPTGTFAVTECDAYRFIRLRQTGRNSGSSQYLIVVAFELFGYLSKPLY
jgi:hypothetical protein